jgi:hypothetical protein
VKFTKVTLVVEADLLEYLTGERIPELELAQTDIFQARVRVVEVEEIAEDIGDLSERRKHLSSRSSQGAGP